MGPDPSTEALLDAGERPIWTGRSSPGLVVARSVGRTLLVLGTLWFGLQAAAAGLLGDPAAVSELLATMAREQPVPLAIFALVVLASPVAAYVRYGRTRYAITDRRLAAWRGGKLRWTLPPDMVLMVRRGAIPFFNRADLRFNQYVYAERTLRWTMFRAVEDAGGVARRVREWLDERNAEIRRSAEPRDRVQSPAGGFSIEVPRSWTVRRYRTAAPVEAALIDPLAGDDAGVGLPPAEAGEDWNVLVALGPFGTSLSVESYAGAAPAGGSRLPESRSGRLALRLLGVGTGEREEEVTLGTARGHRERTPLSGRRKVEPREQHAEYVLDQWLVSRGDHWYRIIAAWSVALPDAEPALASVVETFRSHAEPVPG